MEFPPYGTCSCIRPRPNPCAGRRTRESAFCAGLSFYKFFINNIIKNCKKPEVFFFAPALYEKGEEKSENDCFPVRLGGKIETI